MAKKKKGKLPPSAKTLDLPPSSNPPPAVLKEGDECSSSIQLRSLRKMSKSRRQAPVIYAELSPDISPDPILTGFSALAIANLSHEHSEIINILGETYQGGEKSFSSSLEKMPERERFVTLYFKAGTDVENIARRLNSLEQIVSAVPAPILVPPSASLDDPFNEPLLNGTSGTSRIGLDNQWYIFRCGINGAWNARGNGTRITGKEVVIADIDWGFRRSHLDLKDQIKFTFNAMDGGIDVTQGDFICHGTAVLGFAGAAVGNGLGMAGIAYGADLWAIQAGKKLSKQPDVMVWCDAIEKVSTELLTSGQKGVIILEVQTLKDENIEVIPQVSEVIRTAIKNCIAVCVAAANGSRDAGKDYGGNDILPSGAIIVGATKFDQNANPVHPRSNFGERVTVYAPGDTARDLTCSSGADNGYRNRFGLTSSATPKVAGTVALMLEANSKLNPTQIKDILHDTGSVIPAQGKIPEGRFLNAEAAVKRALYLVANG